MSRNAGQVRDSRSTGMVLRQAQQNCERRTVSLWLTSVFSMCASVFLLCSRLHWFIIVRWVALLFAKFWFVRLRFVTWQRVWLRRVGFIGHLSDISSCYRTFIGHFHLYKGIWMFLNYLLLSVNPFLLIQ